MSKQLDIYIDGQKVNYQQRAGFPLSLTVSIESAEDPGKVLGSSSRRNIVLSGDSDNEQTFQQWATVARENPTAANRLPARVEAGGLPVFTGLAQLAAANTRGAQYGRVATSYEVGLLGNNATWFAAMKTLRIRDIAIIPEHDLTRAYVSDHDNADPATDDWGYTLIRTRDWPAEDNADWPDMTPFLFIQPLLQEAFRLAGYTLTSDFFDQAEPSRYILPLPFRPVSEDYKATIRLLMVDNANGTTVSPVLSHVTINGDFVSRNTGGFYDTGTGFYEVQFSGYYIIGTAPNTINTVHRVRINSGTPLAAFTDPNTTLGIGVQDRVFLAKGDLVDLVVQSNFTPLDFALLWIEPDFDDYELGTTVRTDLYVNPDWLMSDLILGLTHAFCLRWSTDADAYAVGTEPADRYFLSNLDDDRTFHEGFFKITDRDDWTPKLDLSQAGEATALNSRKSTYRLGWKSDSADANVSDLEDGAEGRVFDGSYNFPADRFEDGVDRLENKFFAKTISIREERITALDSTMTVFLPCLQKESAGTAQSERGDFAPRLLYFAGRRGGLDGLVVMASVAGGSSFSYDFPAAWMVNFNDATGLDPSLSFGNESTIAGAACPGLLQRFHLQHIKRLEIGKQLTEYLTLNELDILKLDFRVKKLIGDALYCLQQIANYKPLVDGPTETVLLADAVPEDSDTAKLEASGLIGYVPKIY